MIATVSAPATGSAAGERLAVARQSERVAKSERIVHPRKMHRTPRARNDKGEFPLLAPIKALVRLIAPPQAEPSASRRTSKATPRQRAPRPTAPDDAHVSRDVKAAPATEPVVPSRRVAETHGRTAYDAMVARHAAANGVPPDLVHRIIMRESRYNPRAANRGNYGIMQIRLRTARAMGYKGGAEGLLDPDTNMTYAVRYLAGAYKAARGNSDRAMAKYASGYN